MIESFTVRNFRAFEELDLKQLRRLNIIVGPSSSGKTALLEAIRLGLASTPEVGYLTVASRGIPVYVPPNPTKDQFEMAWTGLFFDFDITRTIVLKLAHSTNTNSSVNIYFDPEKSTTQPPIQLPSNLSTMQIPKIPNTIVPIAFERIDNSGKTETLYGRLNQGGHFHFDQGKDLGPPSAFLASNLQSDATQVAYWFSELSVQNNEKGVVDAVKFEFPDIEDITIIATQQFPVLYATMKFRKNKMPIALISSGINKLTLLIIAIKRFRDGIVLIDELENGIYYKMFPALWDSIHKFSVESNTQLFVSTHSWECLKEAAHLISQCPGDFNLIQVFQERGKSKALIVPGEDASAAIQAGIEVRN